MSHARRIPAIVRVAGRSARSIDGDVCWPRPSGSGGRSARPACRSISAPRSTSPGPSTLVDIGEREQVRAAGAAVFVRRRDDREIYDRGLRLAFGGERGRRCPATTVRARWPPTPRRPRPRRTRPAGWPREDGAEARHARSHVDGQPSPASRRRRPGRRGDDRGAHRQRQTPTAPARSLRHREFDRMTAAELRDAERLVDLLMPQPRATPDAPQRAPPPRPAPSPRGRCSGATSATGGEFIDWVWRRPVKRPRTLVVLCDISGSMERHSRLLLRFIQALSASSAVQTESFVFGTRLTRVTRLLRDRDRDRALDRVADTVTDWAGGTRIGESFREFNLRWARRTLRRAASSSSCPTAGIGAIRRSSPTETARLRRNCHRLVWLNPLAGDARLPAARRRDAGGVSRTSTTSCRPGTRRQPRAAGRSCSRMRRPARGRRRPAASAGRRPLGGSGAAARSVRPEVREVATVGRSMPARRRRRGRPSARRSRSADDLRPARASSGRTRR